MVFRIVLVFFEPVAVKFAGLQHADTLRRESVLESKNDWVFTETFMAGVGNMLVDIFARNKQ